MRTVFFLFFCLTLSLSNAQDIVRVREYLDTLCASGMHGRGYVQKGDKIAAVYLENQFKQIGLQYFSSGTAQNHPYFQYFNFDINTFRKPFQLHLEYYQQILFLKQDWSLLMRLT